VGAERLRSVFGGSIKLGPGLGPAIVAFDLWITALLASQPLGTAARKADVGEVIASVAAIVAGDARGLEQDLLRKAVSETLFISAGQNTEISTRVAQNRWMRYVKTHGQRAMIEMFVANHLWNVLWLRSGDVFGQSDDRAAEYTMRRLRRTCGLLVNAVCQTGGLNDFPSLPAAQQLVAGLEASISV
jgi:hypothetical protein